MAYFYIFAEVLLHDETIILFYYTKKQKFI